MKDRLSAKLGEAATKNNQEVNVPELDDSIDSGNALQAFNQLPVKTVSPETQKQVQEDSVTNFLHKVDEQEKDEQKKAEDDKKQREYDAAMAFGREGQQDQSLASSQSDSDDQSSSEQRAAAKRVEEPMEVPEDNPISAMMALKHPERQREIENMQTEEMAQSHYSNYITTY